MVNGLTYNAFFYTYCTFLAKHFMGKYFGFIFFPTDTSTPVWWNSGAGVGLHGEEWC